MTITDNLLWWLFVPFLWLLGVGLSLSGNWEDLSVYYTQNMYGLFWPDTMFRILYLWIPRNISELVFKAILIGEIIVVFVFLSKRLGLKNIHIVALLFNPFFFNLLLNNARSTLALILFMIALRTGSRLYTCISLLVHWKAMLLVYLFKYLVRYPVAVLCTLWAFFNYQSISFEDYELFRRSSDYAITWTPPIVVGIVSLMAPIIFKIFYNRWSVNLTEKAIVIASLFSVLYLELYYGVRFFVVGALGTYQLFQESLNISLILAVNILAAILVFLL